MAKKALELPTPISTVLIHMHLKLLQMMRTGIDSTKNRFLSENGLFNARNFLTFATFNLRRSRGLGEDSAKIPIVAHEPQDPVWRGRRRSAGLAFASAAMRRQAAHEQSYLNMAASILAHLGSPSAFSEWPVEELVARLEQDGVEVPPDVHPHDLVIFAAQFYGDSPEPPKHQHSDVALTTRGGVQYIVRPPIMTNVYAQHSARPDSLRDGWAIDANNMPTISELEAYRKRHPAVDAGEEELRYSSRDASHDISLPDDPQEARRMRELFDLIRAENVGENDIKTEFKRPNLSMAKIYANMNHPRTMGGQRYSTWALKTGRHMYSRGLFKYCDPCCEGSTSDLARYGVGFSLYFKFLKWLFWCVIRYSPSSID